MTRACPACTQKPAPRRHTEEELQCFHPVRHEFEQATANIRFAKDFVPRLQALMHDRLATVAERFMAWVMVKSWGNLSLDCRHGAEGDYAFQQDCANELGVNKRAISKAANYYERRGYLVRHGIAKILRPVVRPDLTVAPATEEKSRMWKTFLDQWEIANPSDWQRLVVARSTVESLRDVLRSEYKQWRALQTNGGPYKEESYKNYESEPSSRGQSLRPPETIDDHQDGLEGESKPAAPGAIALPGPQCPDVGTMLAAKGIVLDDQQVRQIIRDLGSVPADYYIEQVTERRTELLAAGKPFRRGLAVTMAASVAQIWNREQAAGGPVLPPRPPLDARNARMRRNANALRRARGEPEVNYETA